MVTGEYLPSIDKDELCEDIEETTSEIPSGDLAIFTAQEIAHYYKDGEHSVSGIKKVLNQLQEEDKVRSIQVSRHSDRPITLWFSSAMTPHIKPSEYVEYDVD